MLSLRWIGPLVFAGFFCTSCGPSPVTQYDLDAEHGRQTSTRISQDMQPLIGKYDGCFRHEGSVVPGRIKLSLQVRNVPVTNGTAPGTAPTFMGTFEVNPGSISDPYSFDNGTYDRVTHLLTIDKVSDLIAVSAKYTDDVLDGTWTSLLGAQFSFRVKKVTGQTPDDPATLPACP